MYTHKVQYYETDKMGITHHSNYIRWMEEARIHYLSELGYGYDQLEKDGIISPVVSIQCDYKKTTTFPDLISIETVVKYFNGVRLRLGYCMTNEKGEVVIEGESLHCFLDQNGKPIRLKNLFPDFYKTLSEAVAEE